jgi:hypothetical protein
VTDEQQGPESGPTDEAPDQGFGPGESGVGGGLGDGVQSSADRSLSMPAEGWFGRQLADKLGGLPFTGDPAVDSALAGAAAAQDADPADQLDVYVGTHRALQDRLADSGA